MVVKYKKNLFLYVLLATLLGAAAGALVWALLRIMNLGIEPVFAVAVTTAALCGYIMRKPVMVIGVLLLCFPVTVIIPLAAAAYLGSIIPVPWVHNK